MIAQRANDAAPAVQAAAEKLPFSDCSFDAALAMMTIHHWRDLEAGLAEMVRVARRRVVVVTFDPEVNARLWIVQDYLGPELGEASYRLLPPLERVLRALPAAAVHSIPCPNDCTDRMFATLWARPEQYLDPEVRAGTSIWSQLPPTAGARALERLARDLESGAWDKRYGHLRTTSTWDVGFRLIVAELGDAPPERG